MADQKPTSQYYSNLGGVNQKNSEYTLELTQWLDLRNLDFDVPNALQKRPGSTQAIGTNTSGPVIGLFEYKQLTGSSWVVAGTDTALFYIASNNLTSLDTGWTNGQPQDFLTFVNKMWVANGQYYKVWNGLSIYSAGMPIQANVLANGVGSVNITQPNVFGVPMTAYTGATVGSRAVLFATYSWLRSDGLESPMQLNNGSAEAVSPYRLDVGSSYWMGITAGNYGVDVTLVISGFTVPTGLGITALNIYLGLDQYTGLSTTIGRASIKNGAYNGNQDSKYGAVIDKSLFRKILSVPANTATAMISSMDVGSVTWSEILANASYPAFTGPTFDFFSTYTPKYIDVNQNVMFMSGFSIAPSVIWFSAIGAPQVIQPDYSFEVRTNDGDRIMGHKTFNGNVIVFKEESFHKVIGSTPEDFQLVELSTEFGCLSNNTIIEYNEKLLFLDRKGIVKFDGSGWSVISDAIDEVFRRMNLSVAREKACAIHNNYRNQVWFGIPVDGATQNNLTVVYDYLIDAWTFFDGFSPSSFSFVKGALTKPTAWRGSYSGMIYYTGESFFGDNGSGITALAFSRFEQFNGENSTNVWRRLFLDVATAPGGVTGTINGNVFADYDRSTVKATFSMPQNVIQSKAEVGVVGKAVAVQFSHNSASLPLLLNGFSWSKRNLRNV